MALFTIPAIIVTAPAYIDAAYDWQVENTENLIDQINPFSSTYEYYLNEAKNAYYLLSNYQQNQVRNSTTLFYYLGSNNDHQYVLTTFTNKMAAISARNSTFFARYRGSKSLLPFIDGFSASGNPKLFIRTASKLYGKHDKNESSTT